MTQFSVQFEENGTFYGAMTYATLTQAEQALPKMVEPNEAWRIVNTSTGGTVIEGVGAPVAQVKEVAKPAMTYPNLTKFQAFLETIDVSQAGTDEYGDLRWHIECSALANANDSFSGATFSEEAWAEMAYDTAFMIYDCWEDFYPQLVKPKATKPAKPAKPAPAYMPCHVNHVRNVITLEIECSLIPVTGCPLMRTDAVKGVVTQAYPHGIEVSWNNGRSDFYSVKYAAIA